MHKGYIIIEVESLNEKAAQLSHWKWSNILRKLLTAVHIGARVRLVGVYEEGVEDHLPAPEWIEHTKI